MGSDCFSPLSLLLSSLKREGGDIVILSERAERASEGSALAKDLL